MDSEDYDLWFEHGETPRFAGDTMVSFGFAIDLSDARKTFDQEALGALCYRHAEEAESPGLFSHTHGVVFRDVPYDPGANLDRQIKKILAEGRFVDMRHLMGSTRVRRAKIGVAHIREIRNE